MKDCNYAVFESMCVFVNVKENIAGTAAEWQMGKVVAGSKVHPWMCLSPHLALRECSLIQASRSGIH